MQPPCSHVIRKLITVGRGVVKNKDWIINVTVVSRPELIIGPSFSIRLISIFVNYRTYCTYLRYRIARELACVNIRVRVADRAIYIYMCVCTPRNICTYMLGHNLHQDGANCRISFLPLWLPPLSYTTFEEIFSSYPQWKDYRASRIKTCFPCKCDH